MSALRLVLAHALLSSVRSATAMTPRKPGRPPRGDKAATERIEIRVTRLERAEWEHHAALQGVSLSEWIRGRCVCGAVNLPGSSS